MLFSRGRRGPVVSTAEVTSIETRPLVGGNEHVFFTVGEADPDLTTAAASRMIDLLSRGEVNETITAWVGLENAIRTCRRRASYGAIVSFLDNVVGFELVHGSGDGKRTVEEVSRFAGLLATCIRCGLDPLAGSPIEASPQEIVDVVAPILEEAGVEPYVLHWGQIERLAPAVSPDQWTNYQASNPGTM